MASIISSSLRLFVLAAPETPLPEFLQDRSHYEIHTSYYSASIPVWYDAIPVTSSTVTTFRDEWSSPEAGEVVQAIGAWVICFKKPRGQEDLKAISLLLNTIKAIIEHHTSSSYSIQDPILLAVGMQQTMSPALEMSVDEWDDLCRECGGWEWIDGEITSGDDDQANRKGGEQRNEFGEKVGIARIKEALEAHEWQTDDVDGLSDDLDLGSEDGFGAEAAQVEREMMGLRMAVQGQEGSGEGESEDVEELESMLLRMRAIKDMGADMPDAERRRFAAKAVREVMKT